MKKFFFCLPLLLFCFAQTSFLFASPIQIENIVTNRTEYYKSIGDLTKSPYTFPSFHVYTELNASFSQDLGSYKQWDFKFAGVQNNSSYRSQSQGFFTEQLAFRWQNGEALLPYRFLAGDFYGFMTSRTLQKPLKGFQLELQPSWGDQTHHSFLILLASNQLKWDDFTPSEDLSAGVSYLLQSPSLGEWTVNLLRNRRATKASGNNLRAAFLVASMSGKKEFQFGKTSLHLEGEISKFLGSAILANSVVKDRDDNGYFLEASGQSLRALTYRLRYERYGQDFLNHLGNITSNRRAWENTLGWKFASGLALEGRALLYKDNFQSANPLDSDTLGVTLSGIFFRRFVEELHGNLDVSLQRSSTKDRTTDSLAQTINLSVQKAFPSQWNHSLGLYYQNNRNKAAQATTTTRQLSWQSSHPFSLYRLKGSIGPGILLRDTGGPSNSTDFQPTLSLNLASKAHTFSLQLGYLMQNQTGNQDVNTLQNTITYTHQQGVQSYGLTFTSYLRTPSTSASTESYKLSMFYRYGWKTLH